MYVAPILDERILFQFCKAVKSYATENGLGEVVGSRLNQLKNWNQNLTNLAVLFRYAISGDERALQLWGTPSRACG